MTVAPISTSRLGVGASNSTPIIGVLEWFRPGEEERVERVLHAMKKIGVEHLRTGVSWADWHTPNGEAWYSWLLPRLASEVEVLPSFSYTPPSLGIVPKTSSPPRKAKWYADFLDTVISRLGRCFESVELWNEPNNMSEWDWTLDAHWYTFTEMIGGAAFWARELGKRTVLGGMSPFDPAWLHLMFERNVMDHIDVVGIHGFPGIWEQHWQGWNAEIAAVQEVLDEYGSDAHIWITEAGYSTWQRDEYAQLQRFVESAQARVERLYWYSMEDLHPSLSAADGFHQDEREYHFGLNYSDGRPKLLYRLWSEHGLDAVLREQAQAHLEEARFRVATQLTGDEYVLITGGAGFVGTNLAHHYLSHGERVLIYDDLSRPGVEQNLAWLRAHHGDRLLVQVADVRNEFKLRDAVRNAVAVYHLAAQVAVTTSLTDPTHDFEVNARGTLNLLEALRQRGGRSPLVFTSTNKVYGDLADVLLAERATRYVPCDDWIDANGISEEQPTDFHSPYGASKGAADHYVLDYARTFGLSATVLRMSCIYGPHQFGTEDQGWVAHFLLCALRDQPITIFGDGKQVRDILFVTDLVDAFVRARNAIDAMSGRAFNIGGGVENTTSLLELLRRIEQIHGSVPAVRYLPARTGDQRYYVSDTSQLEDTVDWRPQVDLPQGLIRLYYWLKQNRLHERGGQGLPPARDAARVSPLRAREKYRRIPV